MPRAFVAGVRVAEQIHFHTVRHTKRWSVLSVAFSPGGATIVAAWQDSAAGLWGATACQQKLTRRGRRSGPSTRSRSTRMAMWWQVSVVPDLGPVEMAGGDGYNSRASPS
jgi:hypothetical protein